LKEGRWRIAESVVSNRGGYRIVWDWSFRRDGESLSGSGRKIRVNGKKATVGEQKTRAQMNLKENLDGAKGSRTETNHSGTVLRSHVELRISEDGLSISGDDLQGNELVSTFVGSFQQ